MYHATISRPDLELEGIVAFASRVFHEESNKQVIVIIFNLYYYLEKESLKFVIKIQVTEFVHMLWENDQ